MKTTLGITTILLLNQVLAGCLSCPEPTKCADQTFLDPRRYSVATYDNEGYLLSFPLEEARADIEALGQGGDAVPNHIYIVAHGWNFTLADSLKNYRHYLALIDEEIEPGFSPYFVFINYPSTARPTQDLAASLLPLGLDWVLWPATWIIDRVAFHLPSAWNQSLKATRIAVSDGCRPTLRADDYDSAVARGQGRALVPVSMFLRSLSKEFGGSGGARIHCVGHSYGGKLITLAAIEAIVCSFQDEAGGSLSVPPPGVEGPIDSLVVFNGAFHPSELTYDASVDDSMVRAALGTISRKAVVFSRRDFATGFAFDVSEFAATRKGLDGIDSALGAASRALDEQNGIVREAGRPVVALSAYVVGSGFSAISWICGVVTKVLSLPADWMHHVKSNDTFGGDGEEAPGWAMPLNALHFFLPVDKIISAESDKMGILRHTRPAVGRTGLATLYRGRGVLMNIQASWMAGMTPRSSGVSAKEFVRIVDESRPTSFSEWDPNTFYSFDATSVYDTLCSIVGAHGDIRSTESAGNRLGCRKIDATIRFIRWATTEPLSGLSRVVAQ